ncbi:MULTISPECIES: polysaccharide deacetylase family protein [Clostridium]|uniref:Peptidoglycan-N-acetylmuramic acid deacetylase PdaA n=1 Tax=Clostridium ragsdalei P11 TaxID=1353534 RepID=A0A1A6AS37_9CLOT|nr:MULTISPECIES: polysaccharide deacetylase family protein [Clostridium]OBR92845.1 peptidoglycan-N-acetylmuramic acid deacetylase PdaA precursor [Clostridium ragsdalei P11]
MNIQSISPSILICHGNTDKIQIALTYDAGFEDSETEEILKVLRKHQIRCTFFMTGFWVNKFPKLANKIVSEGHEIGNHSFDHPDMRKIPYNDMIKNIIDGEKAIYNITGIKTTLFREPFGHWNDEVLKAVGEAGYKYSIYWSIDPIDWALPPMQVIVNKVLCKAKNGAIVLMHIAGNNTAAATDRIIENLEARKYKLITVSEILK